MKFNEKLLKGVDETDKKMAMLLLFMMEIGINPLNLFLEKQGGVNFKEDYKDKVNELVNHLHITGAIEPSYHIPEVNVRVTAPLYEGGEITTDLITKLRSYFKNAYIGVSGKSGTNGEITTVLSEWKKTNSYTDSEILSAAKAYVDSLLHKGEVQYIRKLSNFILSENESLLSTWIEDTPSITDNWRNKVS